jgi:small subunit ribosomal protein S17
MRHPRYQKVMTQFKKFYAHDEKEEANVGDKVRIVASRPLSRLKRWALAEVLVKAEQVEKVEA